MNIIKFNNSILKYDGKWLKSNVTPTPTPVDPYNPLNLPSNTFRVRTSDGNMPDNRYTSWETATLVSGTSDVYDVYKSGTDLTNMFNYSVNVVEVLGANTTGITDMNHMFTGCNSLTSVQLFDTSKVTDMSYMFDSTRLISVPLFDTSSCIDMEAMFDGCGNVQSGALALYQQASSQTNPPTNHAAAFRICGSGTVTGAAELAQIPGDWK